MNMKINNADVQRVVWKGGRIESVITRDKASGSEVIYYDMEQDGRIDEVSVDEKFILPIFNRIFVSERTNLEFNYVAATYALKLDDLIRGETLTQFTSDKACQKDERFEQIVGEPRIAKTVRATLESGVQARYQYVPVKLGEDHYYLRNVTLIDQGVVQLIVLEEDRSSTLKRSLERYLSDFLDTIPPCS